MMRKFGEKELWGKRFVQRAAVAVELNLARGFWHPEADNMLYLNLSELDEKMHFFIRMLLRLRRWGKV